MNMRTVARTAATAALMGLPLLTFAQGIQPVVAPTGTTNANLVAAVNLFINGFLVLVALVALVFLIIGGLQYIVSRGDEDAAATAKNTILYAIIGLIVIGLAAAVVNFVIGVIAGPGVGP